MLERIGRLKGEIERLRLLARRCDRDIARQFLTLADEMQELVDEMERLQAARAASDK